MIDDYLTIEVSVYPKSGKDRYGDSSYGDPVLEKWRWEEINEVFKDANGNDIIANIRAFAKKDSSVDNESKVTKNGVDYKVIQVSTKRMFDDSHKEIILIYD